MEILTVLIGKTIKHVSVEQVDHTIYLITVGKLDGEEGPDGEYCHYVRGRKQCIIASSMYDACYKAHHLAKIIG